MNQREEIRLKRFEIRYYLSKGAYKTGIAAFKETILGSRNVAVSIAQSRMRSNSSFKFYEIIEL